MMMMRRFCCGRWLTRGSIECKWVRNVQSDGNIRDTRVQGLISSRAPPATSYVEIIFVFPSLLMSLLV